LTPAANGDHACPVNSSSGASMSFESRTAGRRLSLAETYTVSERVERQQVPAGAQAGARFEDAHAGKFSVLIVWALDRITREDAEGALQIIRQFEERGCTVVSIKESWLSGAPEVQDVLVAFAGWMAQQESARRSGRIRAGWSVARRRARQSAASPARPTGSRASVPGMSLAGSANASRQIRHEQVDELERVDLFAREESGARRTCLNAGG
jgi:Resolvase, N terminal domain